MGRRRAEPNLARAIARSRSLPKASVTDVVESHELLEAVSSPIWQDQPVECDGEPSLAERLDRFGLSQSPRSGRNEDVLSVIRVNRRGHQAVHGRGHAPVQTVCQHGLYHRAFEDAQTSRADTFMKRPVKLPGWP